MTIPRAMYNRAGEVDLRFPFNARLVELLKSEIPARFRSYDPGAKTWTVKTAYASRAVDLLLDHFPDARIERPGTRPEPAPPLTPARPFAVLHLLPTAPPELIDAAYRCLARLWHPDAGGNNDVMQEINGAYATLREQVSS